MAQFLLQWQGFNSDWEGEELSLIYEAFSILQSHNY
jgi:hypothetical protein